MVKADGYGHGAVPCAAAALAGGATWLAVAAAAEAVELRAELARAARILVLGALDAGGARRGARGRRRPGGLAAGLPGAGRARAAPRSGSRPRVHVKYDTGMGRLGERDPDAVAALADAAAAADEVELAGLWTHFATADERDSSFFDEQLERFRVVADAAARPSTPA